MGSLQYTKLWCRALPTVIPRESEQGSNDFAYRGYRAGDVTLAKVRMHVDVDGPLQPL